MSHIGSPQMTWSDPESWDPEWPVCLAKGKVRCFYLYPSWQIGHDVYVDSNTINNAWNVQYVTRFCDKYDTVTLCYTQPNFVPALFLFDYFEPWLEALSERVFHRMMLLWYLIMIKSSYWVWIKSIGQSDRVTMNINYQDLVSLFKSLDWDFGFWFTRIRVRVRFWIRFSLNLYAPGYWMYSKGYSTLDSLLLWCVDFSFLLQS